MVVLELAHLKREEIQPLRISGPLFDLSYNSDTLIAGINRDCGEGGWYRVAHLNMSDRSQQCPPAWRENNTNGIWTCRRPSATSGSCPSASYSTHRQYNRVCGRAIGYSLGGTAAFGATAVSHMSIDSFYVFGVSITHGIPRNHIWTYAAGLTEGTYPLPQYDCPCLNPSNAALVPPPAFVGDNYYCEVGNPTHFYIDNHLYSDDPLWDGQQCEGQCCSNGKSPPWFSVDLCNPTTDDIEVRICLPETSQGDVAVQLLEVYVQ